MLNLPPAMADKLSFVLVRMVVPLWILTGVVLKLYERTPKLLPRNIWQTAVKLEFNLYWLLTILIALELLAVAVLIFLPRLARPMAIFMLACFCAILLGEIAAGNTECGCLGAYSPSPWVMLAIDGSLLLAILLLRPTRRTTPWLAPPRAALAAAFTLTGAVVCASRVLPQNTGAEDPPISPTPTASRTPRALPGYYVPQWSTWVGLQWSELSLAQFMQTWPADITTGNRYVIFYSRSCSHCQELLLRHFNTPPVPTTLVAIAETREGFTPESWLPMECPGCESLELPVGCDWIITTPLVLALQDGKVVCSQEGEEPTDPKCLVWH